MQTPFENGDRMEVCLFEKKEHFLITKITEYRDGAGFKFKTIEIGRAATSHAPPKANLPQTGPVLTVNKNRLSPNQTAAPQSQLAGGALPLSAGNPSQKPVSANAAKRLSAQDAACLPEGKKEIAGDKRRFLPSSKK